VFELLTTSRPDHHTPEVELARLPVSLKPGEGIEVRLEFPVTLPRDAMVFILIPKHPAIAVRCTGRLLTGFQCLRNWRTEKTSHIGGEDFRVFSAFRRPNAQNFAIRIEPPLELFGPENVLNGVGRPTHKPNAWIADADDVSPAITLKWESLQSIGRVELFFDVDSDHALESVLYGHADRALPFCAKRYRLRDDRGTLLHECAENHQARNVIRFDQPVRTSRLVLEILEMNSPVVPATVMEIRCYGKPLFHALCPSPRRAF